MDTNRSTAPTAWLLAGLLAGIAALTVFSGPARSETDFADADAAETEQATTVPWQQDFSASLKLAATSHKLVLVDVYTDWCGWCKRMDRDTFAHPQVAQALNKSFVCVKVDAEDGAGGEAVANRYGVGSFPCILILEPSGKLKTKLRGYRPPEAFHASIARALK